MIAEPRPISDHRTTRDRLAAWRLTASGRLTSYAAGVALLAALYYGAARFSIDELLYLGSVAAMWPSVGVALAALFRGTALAIGLGLVYALVLETIVGTIAALVERARPIREAFLGANAGALADAFRPPPEAAFSAASRIPAGQATLVLIAYTAAFLLLAALLLRRRDVT